MAMMRQLAHIDNNLEDDDVVLRLPIQGNCFAETGNLHDEMGVSTESSGEKRCAMIAETSGRGRREALNGR